LTNDLYQSYNGYMNKTTKENIEFLTCVATLGFAMPVFAGAKLTYKLIKKHKDRNVIDTKVRRTYAPPK
tara:strand:+ start:440 stop:646 length:207 start_codon:yes stop_codon:yes gene_type:complete